MYTEDTDNERAWYIIQSYAGMEYAAKRNLERRIDFNEYGRLYLQCFDSRRNSYGKKTKW